MYSLITFISSLLLFLLTVAIFHGIAMIAGSFSESLGTGIRWVSLLLGLWLVYRHVRDRRGRREAG